MFRINKSSEGKMHLTLAMIEQLGNTDYKKGNCPFDKIQHENLFYYIQRYSSKQNQNLEKVHFDNYGINSARHHIIDADTFIKPLWNKFKEYISRKLSKNSSEKILNDPVIQAFQNYITTANKWTVRNCSDSDFLLAEVVWNPGIIVLGPEGKLRPHTDPEMCRKKNISEVAEILGVKYQDGGIQYLELAILKNIHDCTRGNKIRMIVKLVNCIQQITNLNPKHPGSLGRFLESFWKRYTSLLNMDGYFVYLWSQSGIRDNGQVTYSPSRYCFNLSNDTLKNEVEDTNFRRLYKR